MSELAARLIRDHNERPELVSVWEAVDARRTAGHPLATVMQHCETALHDFAFGDGAGRAGEAIYLHMMLLQNLADSLAADGHSEVISSVLVSPDRRWYDNLLSRVNVSIDWEAVDNAHEYVTAQLRALRVGA